MRFIKVLLTLFAVFYSAVHFDIIAMKEKPTPTKELTIEEKLHEAIVAKGVMTKTELNNTVIKRHRNQIAQVEHYYDNQRETYISRLGKQIETLEQSLLSDEIDLGSCTSSCDRFRSAIERKKDKIQAMLTSKEDSLTNLEESRKARIATLNNSYREKLDKLVLKKKGSK